MIQIKKRYTKKRVKVRTFKKLLPLIVSGAVLICAAIALLIFIHPKSQLEKKVAMPFSPSMPVAVSAAGIFYSDGTYLHCLNTAGAEKWNTPLAFSTGSLFASEKFVAAYSDAIVQVFSVRGASLFAKNIDGTIKRIICSDARIGIFYQIDENNYLLVTDSSGQQIELFDFSKQNILDYGFYQSESLWVLSLDTSGVTAISRITTYKPGKSITGSMEMKEHLVDRVRIYNESMYVFSTTYLMTYDFYGKQQNATMTYGLKYMDMVISSGNPVFVCINRTEEEFSVVTLISPAVSKTSFTLSTPAIGVSVIKDNFYCLSTSALYKYSATGKLLGSLELDDEYDGITGTDQSFIFLNKGTTCYLLPLN